MTSADSQRRSGYCVDQRAAEDAARHRLQLGFAPALGLLDCSPLLRVGGEQRRIRLQLVEVARDRERALQLAPVAGLERGHRPAREAGRAHQQRVEAGR